MTNKIAETWAHSSSPGASDYIFKGWINPNSFTTGFHGGSAHDVRALWSIPTAIWSNLDDSGANVPMTSKVTWGVHSDVLAPSNLATPGSGGTLIADLRDTAGAVIASFYADNTGVIKAYRGQSSGTLIATSSSGLVPVSGVHMWEYQILRHASAGTVEVQLDGVSIFSASGLNTAGGASDPARVCWGMASSGYHQDHYVNDSNGSVNNGFVGNIRNELIMPTADGNYTDFVPDSGSPHYARIKKVTSMTDTGYVKSSTVNAKDTYAMEDLVTTSATAILSVNVYAPTYKMELATRKLAAKVRSNSVDQNGPDCTIPGPISTFHIVTGIFETDPSGGGAWTIARVNAIECGQEITV